MPAMDCTATVNATRVALPTPNVAPIPAILGTLEIPAIPGTPATPEIQVQAALVLMSAKPTARTVTASIVTTTARTPTPIVALVSRTSARTTDCTTTARATPVVLPTLSVLQAPVAEVAVVVHKVPTA